MKTAVSLPDDLYQSMERQRERSHMSRSRFVAEALREYLAAHAPDEVTEAMDSVIRELGDDAIDPFVRAAASRTARASEW